MRGKEKQTYERRKAIYGFICTKEKTTTYELLEWIKSELGITMTKVHLGQDLILLRKKELVIISGTFKINGGKASFYKSTLKDFDKQMSKIELIDPEAKQIEPDAIGTVASKWLGYGVTTKQTVKPMYRDMGDFTERYGENGRYFIEHRPARLERGDNKRKIENRGIGSSFAMIDAL